MVSHIILTINRFYMKYLSVRITDKDKKLLQHYAGKNRMQLSSYVRSQLLNELIDVEEQ